MDRTPVVPPRLWIPALIVFAIGVRLLPEVARNGRPPVVHALAPPEVLPLDPVSPGPRGEDRRASESPTIATPMAEVSATEPSATEPSEAESAATESPASESSVPIEIPPIETRPAEVLPVASATPESSPVGAEVAESAIWRSFRELDLGERVEIAARSACARRAMEDAATLFRRVGPDRGACSFDRFAPFEVFVDEARVAEEPSLQVEIATWLESLGRLEHSFPSEIRGEETSAFVPVWIGTHSVSLPAPDELPLPGEDEEGRRSRVSVQVLRDRSFVWVERPEGAPLGADVERLVLRQLVLEKLRESGSAPLPEWVVMGLVESSRGGADEAPESASIAELLEASESGDLLGHLAECERLEAGGGGRLWAAAARLWRWFEADRRPGGRAAVLGHRLREVSESSAPNRLDASSLAAALGFASVTEWERALAADAR